MTISTERKASRLMRLRRFCGYGAAITVTPYLLIKIVWTLGFFLPTEQMGDASWRIINAVTAVLAAIGILLAMAFCKPWGERLPAWLVALPIWVGTGLLVPMLLIAPVLGPAAMIRDQESGAADFWVYEQIFVMISLFGIGIFLPLALAGYAMARWPEALSGTTDYKKLTGNTLHLQTVMARTVAAGCILLGVIKVFWSVGGSFGINPATMGERDVWWHMLSLSTGVWSFVGAWGILVVSSRRGTRWFLPPMAAAWISSGALFSNNLYSALSSVRLDASPSPEYPLAWLLTTQAGIVLGIIMGMIILLVLHERRRALREECN
ncbi:hypothetical protein [Psychrobacillus sp. FJAT-21963]|uniref:hypothetical protein n=1 Tax=Psychrobacillus sp. FJAT-21963 TaxID=1712028 RepID=UPI0006F30284|nr:hypothetical protein [Psychrobacillus sp. FJAT-21963]KQL34915.1 hypothetical protein AN959_11145 [Psychrobacillus sp. FJAT-21963]